MSFKLAKTVKMTVDSNNNFYLYYVNQQTHKEFDNIYLFLTFMGLCIVNIFQNISNKMQMYTVYFIWKLLYRFWVVPPPIIRSANDSTTASGVCHTVTATCRYHGGVGTGLSVLCTAHSNQFQLLHDSGR